MVSNAGGFSARATHGTRQAEVQNLGFPAVSILEEAFQHRVILRCTRAMLFV